MYEGDDRPTVRTTIARRASWMGFDSENWARGVSFLLAWSLLGLL